MSWWSVTLQKQLSLQKPSLECCVHFVTPYLQDPACEARYSFLQHLFICWSTCHSPTCSVHLEMLWFSSPYPHCRIGVLLASPSAPMNYIDAVRAYLFCQTNELSSVLSRELQYCISFSKDWWSSTLSFVNSTCLLSKLRWIFCPLKIYSGYNYLIFCLAKITECSSQDSRTQSLLESETIRLTLLWQDQSTRHPAPTNPTNPITTTDHKYQYGGTGRHGSQIQATTCCPAE